MFIPCPDGTRLAYTLTPPTQTKGAAQYVVINSATAVRRTFYNAFAAWLADAGFHVLTWDARGIGDSRAGHARNDPARMRDWGALDLDAVLRHTHKLADSDWSRIAVIGHSSGGHLCGLAPSFPQVRRLALVASGTCDWRLYPKREWPRLLGAWYGLAPLALATLGYMPGRWGVGHDLPPGVARDWRNWSARPGYLFSDPTLELGGYAAFKGDLLALNFSDDSGFAPPATMTDLLRHFPNAQVRRMEYNPQVESHPPVGHFGYFHKRNADLWPLVLEWLGRPIPQGK